MKTFFNQRTVLIFLLFFSLSLGVSMAQTDDAVIVDTDFPNSGGLIASLPVNITLIEAKTSATLGETLKQALVKNPDVKNIHLFAPSADASINLGGQSYTVEAIGEQLDPSDFSANMGVTIFVYSCSLAKNAAGISLLENISSQTGFNVASCASCNDLNEEFNFDYSVRPLTITSNLFE
ncbi:DUF4347 domain-containing protein [Muricauda sp. 334s03]|uniref:DUF4347 domain-containing protein n=1 Tax=Flagellimonas yonaguniensis TaxID=3031325 RepID=A0ABT5Y293_9FLAO|nr:DUF4347 domain-containing protein [[Muricauda] yonaguniensis]MDF0717463.1 DUF4347 domain-containing protein [[Muricauda] yonaguniensis]